MILMRVKKIIIVILMLCCFLNLSAKDYPASLFNIYSDGVTINTKSIQFAVDYIHRQGGGRLIFYVGRYLTGSIHLKSNVSIELKEGAALVGALNPFEYEKIGWTALIFAHNQKNIAVTGQGIIDGQGRFLARNVTDAIQKGLIKDTFRFDRPEAETRAVLLYFRGCENVNMKGVTLRNSASWVQVYDQCKNLTIDDMHVDSKAYWNNDGIDIVDCEEVSVTNSYIDASDDGICLKSHDAAKVCRNIVIRNNTIRSSANGIKFGTAAYGGFSNIKILNNRVFDTYRSAVTLAAVDGGFVENVEVDSLQSYHTGNVIFLRIGERVKGKKGRLENISISNVYAEVPASKPDAGYEYEGPVEDMPRNISPAAIVGMPDAKITNVILKNIEIKYPGGGHTMLAKTGLDQLDQVPEKGASYPEFSMFGELPAWGLYIRHANDIKLINIKLTAEKKDYRTALVLDDVHKSNVSSLKVKEPGTKKPIFMYKSTEINISNSHFYK